MRLRSAGLFLAVLFCGVPSSAQALQADDEVGTLIKQLSSDDYAVREEATQKLVRLGEGALPRLEALLPLTVDGETRNRIQTAIDQIGEVSVAGESLITLDVNGADAKDVFVELSRQARAKVMVAEDVLAGLPKVTFQCSQEPFWPVLRKLCSPLGLQPDSLMMSSAVAAQRRGLAAPDRTLHLVKSAGGMWDKMPTTFSGPFMITVQQISESGMVVPATGQRSYSLMVQCNVYAEPKLTVLGRSSTARVIEPDPAANPPAAVPGVNNLIVNRPPFGGRSYYNPSSASVWPIMISLVRPGDATERMERLKATASAKLLVRSETWQLPDIARVAPRSWQAGGRTFTVKSVTRQGQGDIIELVATATRRLDRGGIADREEQSVFEYLELLDQNGRPLNVRSRAQRGSEDPGTIAYTILFEGTAEGAPLQRTITPVRLRWRLPLETKDVDLPIEFEDLPLP